MSGNNGEQPTFMSLLLSEKGMRAYYIRMGVYFVAEKIMENLVAKYGDQYPQILRNNLGKRVIHFLIYDILGETVEFITYGMDKGTNFTDYFKNLINERTNQLYLKNLVLNIANDYLVDGIVDNYKENLPDFIKNNDNLIIVLKFVMFDAIKDIYAFFMGESPIQPISFTLPPSYGKKEEEAETTNDNSGGVPQV